ncbi:DUF2577 family protein [Paenibacillus dendritiformis]|uniref:DUF2577 family protein n=1 Tax=Paenibacillus dendritiformis TaxID=130049 RepID=UPI0036669C26
MDSVDRLAMKFADMYKKNLNPPSSAPREATVVETSPLKIKWGDSVVLTDDKLVVPKLYGAGYKIPYRWQDTEGNMVEAEAVFKVELKAGDKVIIAPDQDLKLFYLISDL